MKESTKRKFCIENFLIFLLGIYTYRKVSVIPKDIRSDTNVIAIIITRWNSEELRNAVREMFQSGTKNKRLKPREYLENSFVNFFLVECNEKTVCQQ